MNPSSPLDTLLRRPVPFTPPTDSTAFARGVMDRIAKEGRPRKSSRRSLWILAAASLAAAFGLHRTVRPDRPQPVAHALPSVPSIQTAASALDERIDLELRRPYEQEIGRLREDLGRAANFALASTGYDLALE